MEIDPKINSSSSWRIFFSSSLKKLKEFTTKVKKIGRDDPRRIAHSLKVGLALTIISVYDYVNPFFDDSGASAMWAVLTVVVVMEYTVGGTLSKGLNRTFATMMAAALALGANEAADLAGEKGEPVVLGVFIFVLASTATFSRFAPEIKKKYDYGVVIFILTFSLAAVSSYRTEDLIVLAQQRVANIAVGVVVTLCIIVFVFPVWAGEDLHKIEAVNLEKLATFLEGLAAGYSDEKEKQEDKSYQNCHKSVLNSKSTEEALANFARWEPWHGRFGFRHPWSQYLKIGEASSQCAYSMDALTAYLNATDKTLHPPQETTDHERRIRMACFSISSELSKAVTKLASGIRKFKFPSTAKQHLQASTVAAYKLSEIFSEEGLVANPAILRDVTVSSLLNQMLDCVQESMAAVEELAQLAHFKGCPARSPEPLPSTILKPTIEDGSHIFSAVAD